MASNEPSESQSLAIVALPATNSSADSSIQPLHAPSVTMDVVRYTHYPHPALRGHTRSRSVAERNWSRVRTVMTWYTRLRQIKRTKSSQRWMKLRTTVQLTNAIASTVQSKKSLKREDSFLKRFSTRQIPEIQETFDCTDEGGSSSGGGAANTESGSAPSGKIRRRRARHVKPPRSVLNPDENGLFYWLAFLSLWVLYNLWTIIVRLAFPELHKNEGGQAWNICDALGDMAYLVDIAAQFRTGYLEQGIMVHESKKLAVHYLRSRAFLADLVSLLPADWLLLSYIETYDDILTRWRPILRLFRLLKLYRVFSFYYVVESRTVYPNAWRVVNLVHILLVLAHWFGCFYFLLSEYEGFRSDWSYPLPEGDFATLTRKYLGSLYWSTLTLTTIGDLPTPETNTEYVFTIASYLIGVFIFATIVGQVGNVITNRNASRLEFERLLDSAKLYMRHHKVPRSMQRRVQRWYDYSWSRGRIQGGGDANSALRILPDKLKTELALHVNLTTLKKVSIFKECQPEFLHDLVLKMQSLIFTPGDMVCRRGEVAREMFIIADGILEVISEAGKVMTTMNAGEFFGEIGILNLDGLNKRTADVRSVGYSELFSLSRENVLSAMKDYPEAEDLLLNLGRKRLLEARKAASQHRAQMARKHFLALQRRGEMQQQNADSGGGNTAAKLVRRLRSVRGLKDVLRKSSKEGKRDQNSNQEAMELGSLNSLPLRQRAKSSSIGSSTSLAGSRAILRRMPHVRSNEVTTAAADLDSNYVTQPLLQQSESPADEHEVIGAGLPLLQRLKLLRHREMEQERQQQQLRSLQYRINVISPSGECSREEKQTRHISFSEETPGKQAPSNHNPAKARWGLVAPRTGGSKYPSRYLPKPTLDVIQSGSSVESTNEQGGQESPTCKTSEERESPPLPTPSQTSQIKSVWQKTKQLSLTALPRRSLESTTNTLRSESAPTRQRAQRQQTIQVASDAEACFKNRTRDIQLSSSMAPRQSFPSETNEDKPVDSSDVRPVERPKKLHLIRKDSTNYSRNYTSIDDLSPEYTVLPFVKRLKILNERQKIAELERQLTIVPGSSVESSGETKTADKDTPIKDEAAQKVSCSTAENEQAADQATLPESKIVAIASPVRSPESTETPERLSLKKVLKQLSRTYPGHLDQQCKNKLMRAQTVEGYAARHWSFARQSRREKKLRKLAHTLPSPPHEEESQATETLPCERVQLKTLVPQIRVEVGEKAAESKVKEEMLVNQVVKEEEYVADLLRRIKDVLQERLEQIQSGFQDRLKQLERELNWKDHLISQLQKQLDNRQDQGNSDDTCYDEINNTEDNDAVNGSAEEEDEDTERLASYFARSSSRGSVVYRSSTDSSSEEDCASAGVRSPLELEHEETCDLPPALDPEPLWQLEFGSCWERIRREPTVTANANDVVLDLDSDDEKHSTDSENLGQTAANVESNQLSDTEEPSWELKMLADVMEKEKIKLPEKVGTTRKLPGSRSVDQSTSQVEPRKQLRKWFQSYPPPRCESLDSTPIAKTVNISAIEEEEPLLDNQ